MQTRENNQEGYPRPVDGAAKPRCCSVVAAAGREPGMPHGTWLWIPGSSRSRSPGQPLRAGPVRSARNDDGSSLRSIHWSPLLRRFAGTSG
jgi:hypothetical protein